MGARQALHSEAGEETALRLSSCEQPNTRILGTQRAQRTKSHGRGRPGLTVDMSESGRGDHGRVAREHSAWRAAVQRPKARAGTLVCEGRLRRPDGAEGGVWRSVMGVALQKDQTGASVGCGLEGRDGRRQTTRKTVESRQEMVGI